MPWKPMSARRPVGKAGEPRETEAVRPAVHAFALFDHVVAARARKAEVARDAEVADHDLAVVDEHHPLLAEAVDDPLALDRRAFAP